MAWLCACYLLITSKLTLQTLFFVYRQSICWARVLLGIRRHGKNNENDAFVTNACSWTYSATVVHWFADNQFDDNQFDEGWVGHWGTSLFLQQTINLSNENEQTAHLLWIDLPEVVTWTPESMISQAILWMVTASNCNNEHALLVLLVWESRSIESIITNYITKQLNWLTLRL